MADDAEHLFMSLFASCISISVKCLFVSFAHFLLEFLLSAIEFWVSLYILDTSLLSGIWFANIIFQPVAYLFILLTVTLK